ncbi:MAG: hypothetical protein AAGD18_16360 [Actinomycetota bacterium]
MSLPVGVSGQWTREWRRGEAGVLHSRGLPDPVIREVSILSVRNRAVVLGSAQRFDEVDLEAAAAAGVEIVQRRGGGGAVWLAPGEQLWLDVVVPTGDELWDADVGRAFLWLGDVWEAALADLGVKAVTHRRGLIRSPRSSSICFAGLGPGEIHVDGAKLVGMSQRRVRDASRFQCVVYDRFDPAPLVDVLAMEPDERPVAVGELLATCVGLQDVAPGTSLADLESAVLRRLS